MIVTPANPQIDDEVASYYYHQHPQAYDDWNREYIGEPHPVIYRFDLRAQPLIDPESTVLDLGCGTGALAKVLKQKGHTGPLIANDISRPMLEHSIGRGLYTEAYHCDAIRAVEELERQGRSIDWVVSALMFGYLSPAKFRDLMTALYRTCRVGMILSVENGVSEEMRELLDVYAHTYEEVIAPSQGQWQVKLLDGEMNFAMLLHLSPKSDVPRP